MRDLHGDDIEIVEMGGPRRDGRYRIIQRERELFDGWGWEKYPAALLLIGFCLGALLLALGMIAASLYGLWVVFGPK